MAVQRTNRRIKPGVKTEAKPLYHLADGTPIILGPEEGEGGQGQVRRIVRSDMVAKIYHDPSDVKERKLELLVEKNRASQGNMNLLSHFRLPEQLIYDAEGRCVGFAMKYFKGITLRDLLLQETLTQWGWTRVQLADLALKITKSLRYLRVFDMLVGDLNIYNILATETGDFAIIDTDSFQVGDTYSCPVLQLRFSSPLLLERWRQGNEFRTSADENYAITTLLFHILLPEKWPFMSIDGRNADQALRDRRFVFPEGYGDVNALARGSERMWYDLPQYIRAAFCSVYNDGADITPEQWEQHLERYLRDMETLTVSQTIFPQRRAMSALPQLHTMPENPGDTSAPGVYNILRHNDSDKSDFAIIYLGPDCFIGYHPTSWLNLNAGRLRDKFTVEYLLRNHKPFDYIDAEGTFDCQKFMCDLAASNVLKEWLEFLAPIKPRVMRFYLIADSMLRNIGNGNELVDAIARWTEFKFNIPSLDGDNEMIADLVIDQVGYYKDMKTIIYVDDKISARLLFCRGKEIEHHIELEGCGGRLMRNRFFYAAGAERTPARAWEEHDASCSQLVRGLDIPEGYDNAKFAFAGLQSPQCIDSADNNDERLSILNKRLIPGRNRTVDYLSAFKASKSFTNEFEYRLALPLIEALRQHYGCSSTYNINLDYPRLKILSTLKTYIL